MKSLELDSKKKTFSLKLELPGEGEPLTVSGSYHVLSVEEKTFFAPTDIQTSKEWLTILATELGKGRTFEIPALLGKFL